ncbi:helix-turn-helix transcriptional regulator [Marinobacterium sediminicola]|uniref:AraC-type DNA-binding protein n=1 Tax=Marinobacterium sediminicola TaxID=518898 RepID=A0ABY1RZM3_9GAMM|nr:DNA-binding response regulator [Marinobacterium sediminicola]ULG69956.1 helix-turn-helix domain-containing protein [Marinobacterium sediminicola]SMR74406.1 AraC-type DNA-binding protein [Marinobacterium sediminicola]
MPQPDRLTLLWLDLRSSDRSSTLFDLFSDRFEIEQLNLHNPVYDRQQLSPVAICIDFDYPDMHGLAMVRELHDQYHLPIIMMTEQHSESLMVWALRVRVWDILLKPMQASTAEYQIDALHQRLDQAAQNPASLDEVSPMLRLPEESRFHGSHNETRTVHPALSYMQLHLGERVSEEQLAQFCNLRPLQFSRQFKKAFGVSFQEMLQQLRIQEATRLLENPDLQILDIALTVGYRDHSYFCRVFKKYLGVTPKTYQEQLQSKSESEQQEMIEVKLKAVANLMPPQPTSTRESWSRRPSH